MKWICVVACLLMLPGSALRVAARALPMGIPDLCLGSAEHILAGQDVTWTGVVTRSTVCVFGRLAIAPGADVTLTNLWVMPGGELVIRNDADDAMPISLTLRDVAINTAIDPEQWGNSLIGLGAVTLRGRHKTGFVRLAEPPRAGATRLTTSRAPEGWLPGDVLAIADSRAFDEKDSGSSYRSQIERRRIVTVAGTAITLDAPLVYDHPGVMTDGVLEFAPHVANLTRSIAIRSENRNGVRGHVLFTHHAQVDIQHVAFIGLGRTRADLPLDCTLRSEGASQSADNCSPGNGAVRKIGTNHIGRYSLHMHHVVAPAFTLLGNVIDDGSKWGITVHNSHFGRISENVTIDVDGAHYMTEDGNETENVFERNLAMGGSGVNNRAAHGREPVGFYARGPFSRWRENVATGMFVANSANASYGFKAFFEYLGNVRIPKYPGADVTVDGQYDVVDGNRTAMREWRDNEAYATESGLTVWWDGYGLYYCCGPRPVPPKEESRYAGLKAWHISNLGVFQYETRNVTFDRLTVRCHRGAGFYGADYLADGLTIRGADIAGDCLGAHLSAAGGAREQRVESGQFRTPVGIHVTTLWTSSYRADWIQPRKIVIHDSRFVSRTAIETVFRAEPVRNLTQRDEISVTAFQGRVGDDFRVYYPQQAPSFVLPATEANPDGTPRLAAAPVTGLTNELAWLRYGVALAGAVAPCNAERDLVVGYVC